MTLVASLLIVAGLFGAVRYYFHQMDKRATRDIAEQQRMISETLREHAKEAREAMTKRDKEYREWYENTNSRLAAFEEKVSKIN